VTVASLLILASRPTRNDVVLQSHGGTSEVLVLVDVVVEVEVVDVDVLDVLDVDVDVDELVELDVLVLLDVDVEVDELVELLVLDVLELLEVELEVEELDDDDDVELEDEVDVEVCREPCELLARLGRRERGCPSCNAEDLETSAALLEPHRRGRKFSGVGDKPGQDEHASRLSRERLRHLEKPVDSHLVRDADEDRPLDLSPDKGRCASIEVQGGVVPKDRSLELLQLQAGLEPEPVDE